jgi:hypothetical protein
LFSPAYADGIGGGIGGANGIGNGVGDPSGIATSKLNLIALSNTVIAAGSPNATVLGTASLLGLHTGTPVWAITDATGTFTISSTTGVVTVLSNVALTPGNSIPIQISVTGVVPLPPTGLFTITVPAAGCTNSLILNYGANPTCYFIAQAWGE